MQPMADYPNQGQIQTTTYVQTAPPSNNNSNNSSCCKNGVKGLGATQVTIGILAIIFHSVSLVVHTPASPGCTGIWMGIFFIVTGSFGIVSGKQLNKGWAVAFLVLSILSVFLSLGLMTSSSASLAIETTSCSYNSDDGWLEDDECYNQIKPGIAAESILFILGLLEFVFAIISSGFGCGILCCYAPSNGVIYQPQPMVQVVQGGHGVNNQPQSMVHVLQGGPGVNNQPQQGLAVQGSGYPPQPGIGFQHQQAFTEQGLGLGYPSQPGIDYQPQQTFFVQGQGQNQGYPTQPPPYQMYPNQSQNCEHHGQPIPQKT